MPRQHPDQPVVFIGIGIGGEALLILTLLKCTDEGIRRLGVALQSFVDRVVIGIENVEAAFQTGLSLGEGREILVVLDIVMAIEMPEKMVEARANQRAKSGAASLPSR